MANKKKTSSGRKTRRPTKAEIERQKAIKRLMIALVLTLLLFFAIFRLGVFGVTVYNIVRLFVGSLAYPAMFTFLFCLYSMKWLKEHEGFLSGLILFFIGLLLAFHAYLFTAMVPDGSDVFSSTAYLLMYDLTSFTVSRFVGGGFIGALFYKPISFLFSNVGSYLIATLLLAFGFFLMSPVDIFDITKWFSEIWNEFLAKREIKREERFLAKEEARKLAEEEKERQEAELKEAEEKAQKISGEQSEELIQLHEEGKRKVDIETGEIIEDDMTPVTSEPEIITHSPKPIPMAEMTMQPVEESIYNMDNLESVPYYDNLMEAIPDEEEYSLDDLLDEGPLHHLSVDMEEEHDKATQVKKLVKPYQLPTIDLFAADQPKDQSKEKKIVRDNIRILEDTFNSFNIKATVERAEIGPSVTKYEVKPAVGVRVNRISNLADDLALALAAKDVRIEAPIPGKSLVGIEVPNSEIATVSFRELWEQSQTNPDNLLEVPLGKAVNGKARSFDLAKMPHLLVAGSTGSGKSVAVNGIISSILMKARPDQVKFMMIDPKMVELSVYNDIPHLLIPVVTNPRKASKALQKVVNEMEERYELFSKVGVRNIAGYNAKIEEHNAHSDVKDIPMPLLVVIVDELADLMMVASKEVEDAIIRLGQKARAAGIHMILATQRPSVDVISGLIKANVPSRIAFAVSSGTDSRTILDENGAEKLLGRGDMLFKPIDENHPVRLQGSFISDDDVERIVSFIKAQAEADYDESFDPGEVSENDSAGGGSSEGDPLFEEAKALVLETQKASASMLQRRLSVGFNRATRLMEELEQAGVIGPAEGTKPRKVLMPKK